MSGEGGEARFRSRVGSAPRAPRADDSLPVLLAELRELGEDAAGLVALGRDAFLNARGRLSRHAADGILIKVQDICDRLPEEFRLSRPEVPWLDIRGLRNRIGHDYRSTDYEVIWVVLSQSLPDAIRRILA